MSSGAYGGLGATVAAFYANNTHGSGQPPLGIAYYAIDGTRAGRVTAYHVVINARPAFANRERVALAGGINLPPDATETNLNSNTCIVWHSQKLRKFIGMAYAAATTAAGTNTAQMRAESTPRC